MCFSLDGKALCLNSSGSVGSSFQVSVLWGSSPMSYEIYQISKSSAGLNVASLSSHSLRSGGCTFLAMCGTLVEGLKIRGTGSRRQSMITLRPLSELGSLTT